MRYTLDPELQNILDWRTDQNMVLDMLLNEMVWVPEHKRRFLPYRMVMTPDKRLLTDQTGRVVCEYGILIGGIIMVDWIRSWQDYIEMDEAGQSLRAERLPNATTTTHPF